MHFTGIYRPLHPPCYAIAQQCTHLFYHCSMSLNHILKPWHLFICLHICFYAIANDDPTACVTICFTILLWQSYLLQYCQHCNYYGQWGGEAFDALPDQISRLYPTATVLCTIALRTTEWGFVVGDDQPFKCRFVFRLCAVPSRA